MQPPGKDKEIIAGLKQLRQKADARRSFGEVGHFEITAHIAFPDPIYAEGHLTAADVRDCSTEYDLRPCLCFVQRRGGTIAAQRACGADGDINEENNLRRKQSSETRILVSQRCR